MGLGKGPEGLQLALGAARDVAERGQKIWEGRLSYLIAMFYARYSKPRNYEQGVAWLNRGLAEVAEAGLSADEYHFESVFNRNGLAMIRAFQGRHLEAIDLCASGLARLNENLGTEKHLLHRSILLYNIAQVYVAIDKQEQALEAYSAVIEMDPNYSEYYNERGNLYLSAGRIDEARADYLRAIELSSPYYEVHTNLGQCYRQMGLYKDALGAYSRSLDLEPNHPVALAGRAQAYDALGMVDQTIEDYSAALNAGSTHWEVPANRGVLYYQTENLPAALEDFNHAIELNPENADLYTNRSRLHQELGRTQDAVKDLYAAVKYCSVPEELESLRVALGELGTSRDAGIASVPA
ncbi:tetratricopeptide repeat protein [Telmatobacter bradus]|uniref:tetratricopeptide repeat protein n=1 Tax=Telmatobacter bradus TaxID=474953 RepID=UPI003B43450B